MIDRIHYFSIASVLVTLALTNVNQESLWLLQQQDGGKNDLILRKFDSNGDGKIDDVEKKAIRSFMRDRQRAGASNRPSDREQLVNNRVITEHKYPSSDGRSISAVLSMPKGEGPFPVVVTIHGGQGDKDYTFLRTMAAPGRLSPTITALNEKNWAILAISFRSGSDALFGMELDDVVAGIRYAKALKGVDKNRVAVVGGSHGGHLALRAAEVMGNEFSCVVAGSPWMTNPKVYLYGKADQKPLADVPEPARLALIKNGKRLADGLELRRKLTPDEIDKLLETHSIEANATKIEIPSLFLTSHSDEQAPHVTILPTIERLRSAGRDVTVFTAQKSPHGFYWGREAGGARLGRGDKSNEEIVEETKARETMIAFLTKHFEKPISVPEGTKSRGEESLPINDTYTQARNQMLTANPTNRSQGLKVGSVPSNQPSTNNDTNSSRTNPDKSPLSVGKRTNQRGQTQLSTETGRKVQQMRSTLSSVAVPKNLERRTIKVGTHEREYFIHIPDKVKGQPAPVVFALHGGASSTGLAMHFKADYTGLADKEGFVVVYPSGINGWNIGSHDAYSVQRRTSNADDLGFFKAMFDALEKEKVADPKRIYVPGGSNGGVMTYWLVCHFADRIAGAGVMVATRPKSAVSDWPKPKQPVSMFIALGTEDTFKPWNGTRDQLSADATVFFWRKQNECRETSKKWDLPDRDSKDGTTIHGELWQGKASVQFYMMKGHGHGWPMQRGKLETETGRKTQDISGPEEFWAFLKQYSK